MTQFLYDTFSTNAGSDLNTHTSNNGQTWARNAVVTNGIQITATTARVRTTTKSVNSSYQSSATPTNANYAVSADLYIAGSTTDSVGVQARASASADTFYAFLTSSGSWILDKHVAGTNTTLATTTETLQTGETYRLTLVVNSTTITGFLNDKQLLQVTDSSITAANFPGVFMFGNSTPSDTNGLQITNLQANDTSGLYTANRNAAANNAMFIVNLVGLGTSWTTGTPGSPTFTLSGGTGASIVSQVVNTATTATLTINTGTANGTLTLTDPTSGATVAINIDATKVPVTVSWSDSNLLISPYNWYNNTSSNTVKPITRALI